MKGSEFDSKDFREFVNRRPSDSSAAPSASINQKVLERVYTDLNPRAILVFLKLLGIHFVTAMATLTVCPQFGFRLIGQGGGLMHVFMIFGEYGCFVACGSFFTSMSLFMAVLVLRGEEIRKIRQTRWLSLGALSLLSLGFFFMLDAQLLGSLTLAWLGGAILGSLITLELGWKLRFGT